MCSTKASEIGELKGGLGLLPAASSDARPSGSHPLAFKTTFKDYRLARRSNQRDGHPVLET